jgi:hypothetical protein
MTTAMMLQADGLSETLRAVRDRFQEGGSPAAVLLVLLILAAVVFAAYLLTMRQRRAQAPATPTDPRKLYRELLDKLNITPPQRRLLDAAVEMDRLRQPAVVLLSPVLFDRYVAGSQAPARHGANAGNQPGRSELVAETRAVLFPEA